MSRTKLVAFALISMGIGVCGLLVCAEVLFRLLPVNEGMRAQEVTQQQPVFHFEPNRQSTYTNDWKFSIVNRPRSNNAGFVSDQPYHVDESSPVLALVGDSYLEALMVPYAETVQGRLADLAKGTGRVYAFAASGAGLPQYLVWARHARDTYHPQMLTVVVIGNDFSESLAYRERSPGFHSFVKRPDGSAEMLLTEYRPSLIRRMLRHSALGMYLFTQVKVQTLFSRSFTLGADDARWIGNVEAQASETYLADSRWAVDRFLDLLPEYAGLPADRIQLVVDGVRPQIYDPKALAEARGSYWVQMRDYVIDRARARGHEVIDLNPQFDERYRRDGQRFEYSTDSHWNGLGHAVAAEAIAASRTFKRVFVSN